jgi:hypothetical protein
MNKRLFAFGCSLTHYQWPTWADIMAQKFDYFENWGASGGGNHFILYSLIEAVKRNNINSEDFVAIMFTTVGREDRWLRGRWFTPGSVYSSPLDEQYIEKFTDPDGFLITNAAIIDAVIQVLEKIGCQHLLLSSVPIAEIDDSHKRLKFLLDRDIESQVYDLYQANLDKIKPSVFEVIFNKDWNTRNDVLIPAGKELSIKDFELAWDNCAGPDWPHFLDFMANRLENTDPKILGEIETQFGFESWKNRILTTRQDFHPTPAEHAEYLEKVGISLTHEQMQFTDNWNKIVLSTTDIGWRSKRPKKRF